MKLKRGACGRVFTAKTCLSSVRGYASRKGWFSVVWAYAYGRPLRSVYSRPFTRCPSPLTYRYRSTQKRKKIFLFWNLRSIAWVITIAREDGRAVSTILLIRSLFICVSAPTYSLCTYIYSYILMCVCTYVCMCIHMRLRTYILAMHLYIFEPYWCSLMRLSSFLTSASSRELSGHSITVNMVTRAQY